MAVFIGSDNPDIITLGFVIGDVIAVPGGSAPSEARDVIFGMGGADTLDGAAGNDVIEVDVRVISATNRDLVKEIQAGNFREDLYFRLSVINIQLPPLRQRRDDIPHILRKALSEPETVAKHGRKRFSQAALSMLMAYPWPGNVRELMNVMSHVLTFSDGEEIDVVHLQLQRRS